MLVKVLAGWFRLNPIKQAQESGVHVILGDRFSTIARVLCAHQVFHRLFCFGYFGLNAPRNSRWKKKHPSLAGRQGLIYVCKIQHLSPKNRVDIWACLRKTCEVRVVAFK